MAASSMKNKKKVRVIHRHARGQKAMRAAPVRRRPSPAEGVSFKKFKSRGKKINLRGRNGIKSLKFSKRIVKRKAAPKRARLSLVCDSLLANAGLRKMLIDVAGENTISVLREFGRDKRDDEIASRTKIKLCEVRAVLNKLHGFGLVEYTRNHDKDSGWYSYIWRVNPKKAEELLLVGRGVGSESAALGDEKYCCPECGAPELFGLERAMESQFRCPGCQGALQYYEKKN